MGWARRTLGRSHTRSGCDDHGCPPCFHYRVAATLATGGRGERRSRGAPPPGPAGSDRGRARLDDRTGAHRGALIPGCEPHERRWRGGQGGARLASSPHRRTNGSRSCPDRNGRAREGGLVTLADAFTLGQYRLAACIARAAKTTLYIAPQAP